MIKVLAIMGVGMLMGLLLRNKKNIVKLNNKSIMFIIFMLLFFMGISVGQNAEIMNNLDTIGLRGLQFAIVAVMGSIMLAWLVYRLFFKNGNHPVSKGGKTDAR